VSVASTYKLKHKVPFPPFIEFLKFVQTQAKIRNDPSFILSTSLDTANFNNTPRSSPNNKYSSTKPGISNTVMARKTDVMAKDHTNVECVIHKSTSHTTDRCRSFLAKSFNDKRKVLNDNKLCFKCFGTGHLSKDCKANIVCSKCNKFHNTVMHIESNGTHGGEYVNTEMPRRELNSSVKCTQICGRKGFTGKSCAKIVLANVYRKGNEENKIRTYAIVDDQSNRSLARPELMNT